MPTYPTKVTFITVKRKGQRAKVSKYQRSSVAFYSPFNHKPNYHTS